MGARARRSRCCCRACRPTRRSRSSTGSSACDCRRKCTGVFPQERRRRRIRSPRDSSPRSSCPTRAGTPCRTRRSRTPATTIVIHSDAVGWSVARAEDDGRRRGARPGSPRVRSLEPAARVPPRRRTLRAPRARRTPVPAAITAWRPRTGTRSSSCTTRSSGGQRDPDLVETYPVRRGRRPSARGRGARWPQRFYANWLTSVDQEEGLTMHDETIAIHARLPGRRHAGGRGAHLS